MIAGDPNIQNVEMVAAALGDLRDALVLVGGCAASLLIDAPTAPPPRVTFDVDLAVEVATLREYHALERKFEQLGFVRDVSPQAPICRWRIRGIEVDLMPSDERVLGFSNRWYREVVATAGRLTLPSGTTINLISAPAFLATKFEAFLTRGNADMPSSHDFEDIINVVEGRQSIEKDIRVATADVRAYLIEQFVRIQSTPDYMNVLPGLVVYDALHAQRVASR
ncbi:MAG: hypothetical protein GEV05_08095 [Betaproteobacteria bacterium]|nr:hypothetical protein [Betaproteobacteria bacterium]